MSEIEPGSGNGESRGGPVLREGFDRRYPFRGSVELAGIATGMEGTGAFTGSAPDSGWEENEAERIRDAASPTVWVAFAHHLEVPLDQLRDALERLGGRVTFSEVGPVMALLQYRFTTEGSFPATRVVRD